MRRFPRFHGASDVKARPPNRCAACNGLLCDPGNMHKGGTYIDPAVLCEDCHDPCPACGEDELIAPRAAMFVCLACEWSSVD